MASVAASQLNENDYLILDQLERLYTASPQIFSSAQKSNLVNQIINTLENELKGGGLKSLVSSVQIHQNEIEDVFNQFIFQQGSSRNSWQDSKLFNNFNARYPTMNSHYQGVLNSYPQHFGNNGIYQGLYQDSGSLLYNQRQQLQSFAPSYGSPYDNGYPYGSQYQSPYQSSYGSPYQNPAGVGLRPPSFGAQYAYGGKKRSRGKKCKYLKKKSTKKRYKFTKNKYAKKNKSKKLKRRR